ncbi:MAG: hypothetical protein WAT19_09885 [Ferruginibacter sp.]
MACLCLLCLLFIDGRAQSVSTAVDKKDILIGEHIRYDIKFTFPGNDYQVQFNIPDSLVHFHIIEKKAYDTTDRKGNFLVVQQLLLTSFDSGKWSIPALPVKLKRGAAVYNMTTDPVLVNVGYSPEDTTGLHDIKPPIEVKLIEKTDWLLIGASIITALILAWLIYRYFKNRGKKQQPVFHSSQTAYQEAINSLEALKANPLNTNEQVKEYHVSLSGIFRRYNSRKQQKNLMNRTTGEMLLELKEQGAGSDLVSACAESLRYNDAVKFAKFIPPKYESEKALDQLKTVIGSLQQFYKPKQTANK